LVSIFFLDKLGTLSSSRVKPRPALTFVLYLNVGHRTTGLMAPATGLGATLKAFLTLASRRLFFLPGWLNHVLTYLCQSLWKWLLWIMLLCFGAMVLDYFDKHPKIWQDFHITHNFLILTHVVVLCKYTLP
jgi:hypothetical protein